MKSLLRKLGVPAVALAGMLALFTPSHADARVRFGVGIGVAHIRSPPIHILTMARTIMATPTAATSAAGSGVTATIITAIIIAAGR